MGIVRGRGARFVAAASLAACGGIVAGDGVAPGGDAGETMGVDASPGDASLDASIDAANEAADDASADDSGDDSAFAFDGFDAPGADSPGCTDNDGDGWTTCAGDCNDHDSQINPCAFDTNDPNDPAGHDGIDNDCDGKIDNLILCETGIASGHDTDPTHYANASDVCDNPLCKRIVAAAWHGPNEPKAHRITGHMGNSGAFKPRLGTIMSFLSNGVADDLVDDPSYRTGDGTDLQNTYVHPDPLTAANNVTACGQGSDESAMSCAAHPTACVHDYTELRMTLTAPVNAGSFAFDFAFFSEEYPEYVCAGINDTFLAMLTSKKYPSNQYPNGFDVSFDANGHRINVNSALLADCNSCVSNWGLGYTHACSGAVSLLDGTGYEIPYNGGWVGAGNGNHASAGTDWLRTTVPIQPGETFTVSWIVFDERDGMMDSSVILDHFHWLSTTLAGPQTTR